jgi:hypothetical protein
MHTQVEPITRPKVAHVLPGEAATPGVHEASARCWCFPRLAHEDPVTRGRVYVHKKES